MSQGPRGRAIVLIDNGYLSAILRDEFNETPISYRQFSDLLCRDYSRLRTYVYDCMPYKSNPPTTTEAALFASKQRFFTALQREQSFQVRFGKLVKRPSGLVQKGVDILLAIDLVKLSAKGQIQKAILVAGDADYAPAVRAARDELVSIDLYHSEGTQNLAGRVLRKYSQELWDACDDRFVIDSKLIKACKLP